MKTIPEGGSSEIKTNIARLSKCWVQNFHTPSQTLKTLLHLSHPLSIYSTIPHLTLINNTNRSSLINPTLSFLSSIPMAQTLSTSSLLLSPKTGYSVKPKNNVVTPCMACFPSRKELPRIQRMRVQASGDNKDHSVEVQHVNKGDQTTAVERKPRRTALDISPFGKITILIRTNVLTIHNYPQSVTSITKRNK